MDVITLGSAKAIVEFAMRHRATLQLKLCAGRLNAQAISTSIHWTRDMSFNLDITHSPE